MQANATDILSLPCTVNLAQYLRVKRDSGDGLAVCGAEEFDLGTLQHEHVVTGLGASSRAAVVSRNAGGLVKMIAAGAITQWGTAYGAAAGKVAATPNGNPIGIAFTGVSNNNDVVSILRFNRGEANFGLEHLTDDHTALVAESGKTFTNLGAGAAVTVTLPQVAGAGVIYRFLVMAAQELRIEPGAAGAIYYDIGGTYAKQTDAEYATANAVGERMSIISDGNGDWIAFDQAGTWTEEP